MYNRWNFDIEPLDDYSGYIATIADDGRIQSFGVGEVPSAAIDDLILTMQETVAYLSTQPLGKELAEEVAATKSWLEEHVTVLGTGY